LDLGIGGRRALVIGASKGLGAGIADALEAEGAEVVRASRSTEPSYDARAPEAAEGLVREVGPLDILVTNTGGPPAGDPLSFTREQWEEAYRSLVLSPIALIEAAVPGMRERGWGRILNVSSMTAREPAGALVLSNAHRSATLAAFKTIADQVAADGVTLNSLLPGFIGTDRLRELFGGNLEGVAERIPLGRLGTVEEFGAAAAFLCSEPARYITGTTLLIDGGATRSV
jgi:3-oxoacyl-[acyl-carrier protein] reductase